MRNVSPRAPDVNCATLDRRPRPAAIPTVLLPPLAFLILVLATACGSGSGHRGGPGLLVLAVGALIVAMVLLSAVGRLLGQVLAMTLTLLKVIGMVGFTAAVVVAAVVLAVLAATAQ